MASPGSSPLQRTVMGAVVVVVGVFVAFRASSAKPVGPSPPTAHEVRRLEGWTVRVDQRLLAAPHEALGRRALVLLTDRLRWVKVALRAERVAELQRVVIQLDQSHGKLDRMQYHPSARWLANHGYATDLEKCVHIPFAKGFVAFDHQREQPWSVMHELAHAYHDQTLGYDEPSIKSAWQEYRRSGAGDGVLHIAGGTTEHYALTNHTEFFAEMTEAYLGCNDFYPFVHGELRHALPEVYRLMRRVWGPLR